MSPARPLWSADQLLVTADTPEAIDAILHPKRQLGFLSEVTTFAGPSIFADSLVYSTSQGNTGWTAFRMGTLGHVTFHHWDTAKPNLLQLDVYGIGSIDQQHALDTIRDFWVPLGMRAVLVRRNDPRVKLETIELRNDVAPRAGTQEGLGPGDHLHLLVDQSGIANDIAYREIALDNAITELVMNLKMRCITPVTSRYDRQQECFQYDAIVGITTSHVSLRLREGNGRMSISLDVFSCRTFRPEVVHRWLDAVSPTPDTRRSILYNRHPRGEFVDM